ncbi:MAG: hypothetical protein GY906_12920 [bacterium]|nr:hypothetical protein [bacterium]
MVTAAQKKAAAAKRKAASKKKPTKTASGTGLGAPAVVQSTDVEFKSRATGSKYDFIVEQAVKLKVGQTLKIPVEKDADIVTLRNRLGAVVRRKVAPKIKGKTRLRVTEDGQIAISVEKE